jgi:hypothetical protein
VKAVVFHGAGDIRLEDVPEPKIQEPTDAGSSHPSARRKGPGGNRLRSDAGARVGGPGGGQGRDAQPDRRLGAVDPSALVTEVADVHDAVRRTRSSTAAGRRVKVALDQASVGS